MPYDEQLAERVRTLFHRKRGVAERKMFGGLAFLVDGKMCCGVLRNSLVVRLGNEGANQSLQQPHTRPMNFTGRVIRSMLYVDPPGLRSDRALQSWVQQAIAYAKSLPPK